MSHLFLPVDEQLAILRRNAVDLYSEDQLRNKLERSRKENQPLTIKAGFDPSSPDLHLGHTVLLRKMKEFQDLGHRAVFVVGSFTARIGDPTGKKTTRPQLTNEQVDQNAATYTRQVFKLLDREKTVIKYNGEWLDAMGSGGLVQLAGRYTLARMMEREDFRSRYESQQPISLHELLYPLVQAYDSIHLKADVELGGHDQIFNLLVGRDLMKDKGLEPQVVLTVPLLVGLDGTEKMSKSLGNAIAVEDSPSEIYGKTMSIPDDLMWEWYRLLVGLEDKEISHQQEGVASGELHPKRLKQSLARQLVTDFHSQEAATAAEEEFTAVFAQGGIPDDIAQVEVTTGPLSKLLTQAGLASSNKESRRLIEQGAVAIDGEKQTQPNYELVAQPEPYLVKVGKRRFAHLHVS